MECLKPQHTVTSCARINAQLRDNSRREHTWECVSMADTIKDCVVTLDQVSDLSDLSDLSAYNVHKQTTTVKTHVNSSCRRQLSLFKDDICVQRCVTLTAVTGLAQWEHSKYWFHRGKRLLVPVNPKVHRDPHLCVFPRVKYLQMSLKRCV